MLDQSKPEASPWHEGELTIQRSVGVVERMDGPGRNFVRKFLPEQHQLFYPLLPLIVLGAVDPDGDVWATMRAEKPGFMRAADAENLQIHVGRDVYDPADAGLEDGDGVGMLGIQLETRRRNRLNGSIQRKDDSAFTVQVAQSYGNCPQYIQLRDFTFTRNLGKPAPSPRLELDGLDQRARDIIAAADAFFVASYVDRDNGERQVDVSHRGGKAGFVRIGDDGVLTVPDFAGNLFFNTLGNFLLNPKAGLLFVDFSTGDMLQMTGSAEVILDSPEIAAFQGAERLWRFIPRRVILRPAAMPLRWALREGGWSPNSLMTGDWHEAETKLAAAQLAQSWRIFRIARIAPESTTIRSLFLEPTDTAGLSAYKAGDHLPVRVALAGHDAPLVRSYTLSSAPADGVYRISVKRDGLVSSHLHGLKVGDTIEVRAPAGGFNIDAGERRPAVLLAAGVGITPMISMLRHIIYEGQRTRTMRPTWLFQSAHAKPERAFDREIASLVKAGQGAVHLIRALSSAEDAAADTDYDLEGRIDVTLLQAVLPFDDYDFYLCGPGAFMQSMYDGLRALNIADNRIHAEAFGTSPLTRKLDAGSWVPDKPAATEPVHVVFAQSGKEARWEPGKGTLLELAEARGLSPEFSCRSGNCGSCRAKILEGEVSYLSKPSFSVEKDEALVCCAVPAEGGGRLHLGL